MSTLTTEILLRAYRAGIFPMSEGRNDPEIFWVDPEMRGIIPLETFSTSKSLRRALKKAPFTLTCDTAFRQIIEGCANATELRPSTWINGEIIRLYSALHEQGNAHSVECWQDGELVGGVYGISIGAAFFGESMFSKVSNASKVALVALVAHLKRGGYRLLDTQFITDHLRQFGAVEISRQEYHLRLVEALAQKAVFYPDISGTNIPLLKQSTTQTS
ncbi:MAG: leucyl/phenylalanyl-tRNA--protein transferase [Rhodospirillaceae bacterium]|jgi:leucyl/phenylalanyl-tRNA---protein transferase|nr:leucyl/phenylalanyl-tRNA--protein transferase [Rhodospirillaceae bacterium]MBT5658654.1 leucyl/phenylalanyl-tRNA--protein transferase [Rhodospirillaceae bacterium]MBT5751996.1 leucyl/phenylalanyl-tRNA--protein transferase [Rhodospirillaceae bacterium]